MTTSSPPDRTFELYVRSLSPSGTRVQQEAIIERLEYLEEEDGIDEFTLRVWGKQIDPSTAAAQTNAGQFVIERVVAFEKWAQENGLGIKHFFERREIQSQILDETHSVLTLPLIALAEVCDGEIQRMAPCIDGATIYTVIDWVDALEDDREWLSTMDRDGDREREEHDHRVSDGSLLVEEAR